VRRSLEDAGRKIHCIRRFLDVTDPRFASSLGLLLRGRCRHDRLRYHSVALEELDGAFVALGGRAGREGPEIPPPAPSRVLLT
jgi:hypothetical protein